MCTPVHSSHVMAVFMKSVAGIIDGLRVRGVAARKQRGHQERSGKARAGMQKRGGRDAAGAQSTSSTAVTLPRRIIQATPRMSAMPARAPPRRLDRKTVGKATE